MKRNMYEDFLKPFLSVTEQRRELCEFEHDLISDLLVLHRKASYYPSYELLSAVLISTHPLHDPAHHINQKYNFQWISFGFNDGTPLNISFKALNYKFENNLKSFSVYKFDNAGSNGQHKVHPHAQHNSSSEGTGELQNKMIPVSENQFSVPGFYKDNLHYFLQQEAHNCLFQQKRNQVLGLNFDGTSYRATSVILQQLYPCLRPGSLLYFQKLLPGKPFPASTDALRALFDFAAANPINFELIPVRSQASEVAILKVAKTRFRFRDIR